MAILADFYSGRIPAKELVSSLRDLSVVDIGRGWSLILACDSDGGIGGKEEDAVFVEPWIVGYFGARVPMMEVLAVGGAPFLLVNTLAVEMEPHGREIIGGIRKLCLEAGFPDLPLNGSTEENVPTKQTGVGVTVLAVARTGDLPLAGRRLAGRRLRRLQFRRLQPGASQPGDLVAVAGVPKSGPRYEVRPDDPEILSLGDLKLLRENPWVHDILPVGSRGIAYESGELARSSGLGLEESLHEVDVTQSAGPSTCIVFSAASETIVSEVSARIMAPVRVIGRLRSR